VPLNLLCLGSFLQSKGLKCKIFELGAFNETQEIPEGKDKIRQGLSDEKIVEIIKTERPKIIGMGCMYSRHYIDVVNIAKLIKQTDPTIKIIIGGNHATDLCDLVLKSPYFDFIVIGEGEITFYELCQAILNNQNDFYGIKGLAFRKEGEIIKTEKRELLCNLDDLPLIDYSLINLKKYLENVKSPYIMRIPVMGISSSRGCPGHCVYCTVKAVWGRRWRAKSAMRTVDEIESLYKNYDIREFSFLDDSASVNKIRWNEICNEIIKRKLDIRWSTPNGIAHWTLDKPTLLKMKKSGCYRITFGIESGDEEIRKFIGKPYPLSQAKELIQYANKIGLWTICTNIIGFPYETREQIARTVEFAKKSGTDFAAFYPLSPMPTSNVYQYFKKEGLLDFDYIFGSEVLDEVEYEKMYKVLSEGGAPTVNFKPKELKKIIAEAYKNFIIYRGLTFLNPLRILRKIHSIEDLRYTTRLIFTGIKLFIKSFYKRTTQTLLR
ncbi:B12-binding domain-containing radical SAM protein, partial [Patescibacteria group bacterium]|nr:B12-binding domain-containing radical SAM protein [Patescibacteria group bacterium]